MAYFAYFKDSGEILESGSMKGLYRFAMSHAKDLCTECFDGCCLFEVKKGDYDSSYRDQTHIAWIVVSRTGYSIQIGRYYYDGLRINWKSKQKELEV